MFNLGFPKVILLRNSTFGGAGRDNAIVRQIQFSNLLVISTCVVAVIVFLIYKIKCDPAQSPTN